MSEDIGVDSSDWDRLMAVLAPLAAHNPETYAHSLRVGLYAASLARQEELDASLALHGGCAHDLGKIGVSNDVLRADIFGPEERDAVRGHASAGHELLGPTHLFTSFIAGLHHQFQDDPYGIDLDIEAPAWINEENRDSILEVARIVALCDFYDSLTTRDNNRGLVADISDPAQVAAFMKLRFGDTARVTWLLANSLVIDSSTAPLATPAQP
jgi:hypothetical protein